MISRPLRIRYTDGPLREAAAWLIPGSDPAAWLEELARWQVPHAGLCQPLMLSLHLSLEQRVYSLTPSSCFGT